MTIDTKELRRLAHRHSQCALSIPVKPSVIFELLDRLEAAESALSNLGVTPDEARDGLARHKATLARLEAAEKAVTEAYQRGYSTGREEIEKACDALRAKVERMERQEPVAWCATDETGTFVEALGMNQSRRFDTALYLAPGAQPAPSEKDEPIRKAWARFSNALHRSPDAPYPGMSEAFEKHFSQSFTDREWRAESGTWAAAWKAAKRHEAQAQPAPSIPEGWIRAIDEALVVAHIGVANADDTYEQAKEKLTHLIGFHVDVATDPAVNGGWKLVPIEPTEAMLAAGDLSGGTYYDVAEAVYRAMLAAAPEMEE